LEHLLVGLVAAGAAALTFFSGFGLGTAMLPVFAIFFEPEVAVAATAVVHLLNNVLKLGLLRGHVDGSVVLRFGFPAMVAAFGGAVLLDRLAAIEPAATYRLAGRAFEVEWVAVVLAAVLLAAGVQELTGSDRISFGRRALPVGGLVSGFLGGLAGLQGAVRSAFLLKLGLSARGFIATGVAVGLMVDVVRVAIYGTAGGLGDAARPGVIVAGVAGASIGTVVANRFLHKATIGWVRLVVGTLLIVVAVALGAGLL